MEVISRDRATAYAEGPRIGATAAIQVADRFHLAKNLGDALERILNRHRALLQQAQEAVQANTTERDAVSPDAVSVNVATPASPPSTTNVNTGRARRQDEDTRRPRAWRYGRYEQVKAQFKAGMNIAQLARAMHLDRVTVRKFLEADIFPERSRRPPRACVLDGYKADIQERCAAGCHNAVEILDELRNRGFTGHYTVVKDYLQSFRWTESLSPMCAPSNGSQTEPDRCSPRRVAAIVLKKPGERTASEERLLAEVDRLCEPFRSFHAVAQGFLALMRASKDKGNAVGFAE